MRTTSERKTEEAESTTLLDMQQRIPATNGREHVLFACLSAGAEAALLSCLVPGQQGTAHRQGARSPAKGGVTCRSSIA